MEIVTTLAGPLSAYGDGLYVDEEVGRGATSRVMRARLRVFGIERTVAMKVFSVPGPVSGVLMEPRDVGGCISDWRLEAERLAALSHGTIPALVSVGRLAAGEPYLLLEWVSGRTLRDIRRERVGNDPVPGTAVLADRVAVHVACEVLGGLSAVRCALPHLVHNDVTPANLMISVLGEVKVLDFGSAEHAGRARGLGGFGPVVRGKVGYVAPERFLGPEVDARADQFSLGVVLYEMLAGVRPWLEKPRGGEVECMLAGRGTPLEKLRPGLPSGLVEAVSRMIATRPADRFRNAEDALRALAPHGAGEIGPLRLRSLASMPKGDRAEA